MDGYGSNAICFLKHYVGLCRILLRHRLGVTERGKMNLAIRNLGLKEPDHHPKQMQIISLSPPCFCSVLFPSSRADETRIKAAKSI